MKAVIDEACYEACSGCGAMPGDGLTDGCDAEDGCAFYRSWQKFDAEDRDADNLASAYAHELDL